MNAADAIMTEAFLLACQEAGLTDGELAAFHDWLKDKHWTDGITRKEWENEMANAATIVFKFRCQAT